MFQSGTLINHGEAEDFVNIIRTSRNSIKNMDSREVKQYLSLHDPDHRNYDENPFDDGQLSTVQEEESKYSQLPLSPRT